jgi:hypothetical protein
MSLCDANIVRSIDDCQYRLTEVADLVCEDSIQLNCERDLK